MPVQIRSNKNSEHKLITMDKIIKNTIKLTAQDTLRRIGRGRDLNERELLP